MSHLRGTGVSPGIAVGRALVMERDAAPVFRLAVPPERVEDEVRRLEDAIAASREQLRGIKERLSREVGAPHAYIFDAHLLMLDDPLLRERAVAIVRGEGVNAEWALRAVSESLHALFSQFSDAYLRERSTDLDDVIGRIQLNLRGTPEAPSLSRLPGPVVLVAGDLVPSEAAELDWDRVLAIVTDVGSSTYHTAIIARSLGIPAVAGLKEATRQIPPGSLVAVDGGRGEVSVEPSGVVLEALEAAQETYRREEERLRGTRGLAARTQDGVLVRLEANVEFPEEAATAQLHGADGIGLFRSEYLLGRGLRFPSEDQQLDVYRRLVEQMQPHPVTVRTWDVGLEALGPSGPSSPNPALGERALRLLRRSPEPFRVQLRALLRAGRHGPVRIMFPFVSGPGDLRLALALLEQAKAELRAEGVPFREDVPVGINLEVPSAAVVADLLAAEVDFFSVGTNDLIQYLLAVDRTDPRVSSLYEPLHPAVLRTLRWIAETAEAHNRPLSVCGEMAGQPVEAVLLVGLGFRSLSMAPSAIPRVKEALRAVRAADARALAERCLALSTCAEITALVGEALPAQFGETAPVGGDQPGGVPAGRSAGGQ
ncbi:MAG TPA: phosphoenolpyruvate--protein phosphotransferase [Vicinamibacteria bacterium]|nr:phosphoenolpyruvate--protein phosphotransferase [Vicinamibacteria bacterium]